MRRRDFIVGLGARGVAAGGARSSRRCRWSDISVFPEAQAVDARMAPTCDRVFAETLAPIDGAPGPAAAEMLRRMRIFFQIVQDRTTWPLPDAVMGNLFDIRPARATDVEAIYAVMNEVASRIPVCLSTPKHIEAMKKQICEACDDGLSVVAVDKDGIVVGFQLAKWTHWYDDQYIHLTYAGVTGTAAGKKVFRRLIEAEKRRGMPLVARVKPDNKSDAADRLVHYSFQRWHDPAVNNDYTYRWDPS